MTQPRRGAPMSLRAFVAVEVPPRPALEALARSLAALGADLKVVPLANLHLTLAFLGPVDERDVPVVQDALRETVAGAAPFVARLRGVGTFPPRGAPRVVWAGLEGADALVAVAQ